MILRVVKVVKFVRILRFDSRIVSSWKLSNIFGPTRREEEIEEARDRRYPSAMEEEGTAIPDDF